jgi:hypothetical protein
MSDAINTLSSQTGIGADLIRQGLGAVLKMLQEHLPPELFSKVQSVVPGAGELISTAESTGQASGGMIQAVTNLAGKLFGGQGKAATDLLTRLSQAGFSAEQLQAFLPKVLEFLQDKLPPEVLEKIKGLMPGLSQVAESS